MAKESTEQVVNKSKFLVQFDESKYNKQLQICDSSVEVVADKLYRDVLDGEVSAVALAEMVKFLEEICGTVKKKTDDNGKNSFISLVRDEIKAGLNEDGKYVSKYGTIMELAETGTKYNFTKCGDPLWNYYNKEMEKLDKLAKAREKYLKTITEEFPVGNVLIPETGELHEDITLYPPIKTSNSSFKQTLLKS